MTYLSLRNKEWIDKMKRNYNITTPKIVVYIILGIGISIWLFFSYCVLEPKLENLEVKSFTIKYLKHPKAEYNFYITEGIKIDDEILIEKLFESINTFKEGPYDGFSKAIPEYIAELIIEDINGQTIELEFRKNENNPEMTIKMQYFLQFRSVITKFDHQLFILLEKSILKNKSL